MAKKTSDNNVSSKGKYMGYLYDIKNHNDIYMYNINLCPKCGQDTEVKGRGTDKVTHECTTCNISWTDVQAKRDEVIIYSEHRFASLARKIVELHSNLMVVEEKRKALEGSDDMDGRRKYATLQKECSDTNKQMENILAKMKTEDNARGKASSLNVYAQAEGKDGEMVFEVCPTSNLIVVSVDSDNKPVWIKPAECKKCFVREYKKDVIERPVGICPNWHVMLPAEDNITGHWHCLDCGLSYEEVK